MLTAERLRAVCEYDPATGIINRKGASAPRVATGDYLRLWIDGHIYLAHRLIWLYMHGVWPAAKIDHINGDRTDNRAVNLRDVSNAVNMQNRKRPQKNNKTGFLGVSVAHGRFMASIRVDGKRKTVPRCDSAEEAHAAYVAAKRLLHEGNTL